MDAKANIRAANGPKGEPRGCGESSSGFLVASCPLDSGQSLAGMTKLLNMRLMLFQRDDCRLCDLAIDVLAQARVPDFSSVFIDDDADLESRYGERVPVLRDEDSGRELDWPFDADRLRAWINGSRPHAGGARRGC